MNSLRRLYEALRDHSSAPATDTPGDAGRLRRAALRALTAVLAAAAAPTSDPRLVRVHVGLCYRTMEGSGGGGAAGAAAADAALRTVAASCLR